MHPGCGSCSFGRSPPSRKKQKKLTRDTGAFFSHARAGRVCGRGVVVVVVVVVVEVCVLCRVVELRVARRGLLFTGPPGAEEELRSVPQRGGCRHPRDHTCIQKKKKKKKKRRKKKRKT
ncbi:hypothetical protein EYF80_066186 [Liparis tanakae]|uniref:Uncharacterized protein n=1 Tax=Liparis tanakae TaxID=230148 RepID=A0A4Z2E4T3_9TELE|nr:hypothetical protein EYF80_066186 [Liparis tanakae]